MKTWFVQLGTNRDKNDKKLYQDLAKHRKLVMIGYGLNTDITGLKDFEEVRDYLKSKREVNPSRGRRASLINAFMNQIENKHIIVCPFWDNPRKYRIGRVIGTCGSVKSFFKGRESDLKKFLKNYSGIQPNPEVKPARKVKWLTTEMDFNDLPANLQDALSLRGNRNNRKRSFPGTTTELKKLKGLNIFSQVKDKFKI